MSNLKGRSNENQSKWERDEVRKTKSVEEFDFGPTGEVKDECKGSGQKNEPESESTEQEGVKDEKGKVVEPT